MHRASREELYRRLEQSCRLVHAAPDEVTRERLKALKLDLERQIALVEARDADAPGDA
jgi:hypothetical protein